MKKVLPYGNREPQAAFSHKKAENAAKFAAIPCIKQKNGSQQKIGAQHARKKRENECHFLFHRLFSHAEMRKYGAYHLFGHLAAVGFVQCTERFF